MNWTVEEVIKALSDLPPTEELAITWWSSEDIKNWYPNLSPDRQQEVWESVVGEVRDSLESLLYRVNDNLFASVSETLTDDEINEESGI